MAKRNDLINKKIRRELKESKEKIESVHLFDKENEVCKNAEYITKNKQLVNVGCKNLRENGSSHCSDCSYKYAVKKYERN
ncbi:MAG: hypothetical protein WCO07_01555 [bacterium]